MFLPTDPCLVLEAPVPQLVAVICQIHACFDVFSMILAVFACPKTNFCNFRRYSDVTLEMEIYLILGICFFVLVKRCSLESQEDADY